ncbi:MAG: 30S ribosomal protein S8 [Candidatus Nitrosocaldaceae archaeon]|nr:MAG: 30S ribosomal protein S8 [Candidatus Nitrosothermus koennekii]GIU72533.1 MAG: 30S ribosomal protein S8 [Candidatus Nitrosocaldaceae archaeon]
MPAQNILANLFTTIYNNEMRRKKECIIAPTSKLAYEVLNTMKKHNFIEDFEYIEDGRGGKFRVKLNAQVNKCAVITPRFSVKKDRYVDWERNYLPSYTRGILIVSTPKGVMSHHQAQEEGLGGVLIGYVY